MDQTALDAKLTLIRGYLEKHLAHCVVQEHFHSDGPVHLSVVHGTSSRCAVQVSPALLSDPHVDAMELRWALKDRDIATRVRGNDAISLDHETLRIGDLGAMARRPRHSRAVVP
jgi:hypothetical protein